MRRKWMWAMAVCCTLVCALLCVPAAAEKASPITMTASLDPDLELSGDGTVSFITFTVANASEAPYTLNNASLSCEALGVHQTLDTAVEVPAHGTKEIILSNIPITDTLLDTALIFLLSWQDISYAPEDLTDSVPLYSDCSVSAEIRIPRFVEPVMQVSVSSDLTLAKSGATVTATYTLKNDTKFDMTSLSLYDVGTLNLLIPLEATSLLAGETMEVVHTFEMGDTTTELQPKVLYNVRGKLVETTAETATTVENAVISLDFLVESYPPTETGVLFSLTVTNSGTHAMTDITVHDEIQTEVAKPFNLDPGQTKTLSYTVTTAVSATQSRMVTFTITATDCFYDTYTFVDPNTYEVLPYITSEQVNISLYATLTDTYTNENGVLCGTVSFELRNYSSVTLTNVALRETLVYTAAALVTYPEFSYGITTFSAVFAVADLSALSFVLSAYDPAGNEYHSQTVTIDLSGLSVDNGNAAEDTLVNPDVIGSGIDMNKYFKLAYKTLLIIAISVGVCLVIIYVLYSAERRERANLPLEDSGLAGDVLDLPAGGMEETDSFRTGRMEPIVASEQAAQYGYVAPTKLRYIDQTSRNGFSDIKASADDVEDVSDVKVYLRTDGKDTAPVIVKRRRAIEPETLDETRHFRAVEDPDATPKTLAKQENRRQKPVPKTDAGYPLGIPSAVQKNRRQIARNPVYRVERQTPSR